MFAKLIDDSYSDCLTSHTGFTSNYKSYCDNGKQLIEECDFDEDFDCGNGEGASFKKRSLLSDGKSIIRDYLSVKTDKLVNYAENKTMRIVEKTANYTRRIMDKVATYKNLFFSSSSFFEIGKAYTQNCNDKVKEYFGTFRTDSKREYVVKIVCNSNEKGEAKPYISELKTKGCVYIPKKLRIKSGDCPSYTALSSEECSIQKAKNISCPYDWACGTSEKCCPNGCENICTVALNMNAKKTTTQPTTTTNKYDSYHCTTKGNISGYFNCLFKRKQCSSDEQCRKQKIGTKCCPTVCGKECLEVLPSCSNVKDGTECIKT